MKLLISCLFLSLLTFSVPEAQANHHVMRGGNVQCCTDALIKKGEVCDMSCRKMGNSSRGIKNAGNVPCCDTPGLNPMWQCNTSCSYYNSNNSGVRRCTGAMRAAGRCR